MTGICELISHVFYHFYDYLCNFFFVSEGMLRKAAEAKCNKDVLIHIWDKDCVALEVRYHASCYKSYT